MRSDHMAAVATATQLAAVRIKVKDRDSSGGVVKGGAVIRSTKEIAGAAVNVCAKSSVAGNSSSSSGSCKTVGISGGIIADAYVGGDTEYGVDGASRITITNNSASTPHASDGAIMGAASSVDLVEDDDSDSDSDRGSSKTLFFNSFFFERLLESDKKFNYNNVRRWTKKYDIFSMTQVFHSYILASPVDSNAITLFQLSMNRTDLYSN